MTPTPLSFHPARSAEDISGAREVFRAYGEWIQRDMGFSLARQSFDGEIDALPGRYAPPEGDILVATEAGRVLAAIAYYKFAEGIAELKRFYIYPGMGGRGVGAQLFHAALLSAKGRGYLRIRLDTLRTMEHARRIYARYTFREIAPWNENHKDGDLLYLELDTSTL